MIEEDGKGTEQTNKMSKGIDEEMTRTIVQ